MFVTSQGNNNDGLVSRILDGRGSHKYRPMDYDQMMEKVLQKKLAANSSVIKMCKLKSHSKRHQKNTKTKQHQIAWQKEMLRLKDLRHLAMMDITEHIAKNAKNGLPIYADYDFLVEKQAEDMAAFKEQTLDPIWNLCEDVKFWLQENLTENCNIKGAKLQRKAADIIETVKSVSEQQGEVLKKLNNEQMKLEEEIRNVIQSTGASVDTGVKVERGVPPDAMVIPCPNEDIKVEVLSEFFKIDENFEERLQVLKVQYADVLSYGENGGWDECEHLEFTSVLNQYAIDLPQRNILVFDRLQRQFPDRSSTELRVHQEWSTSMKFYSEHRNALIRAWQRCRVELLYKVYMILTEVCCMYEEDEIQSETVQKQRNICDQLYKKVSKWREQKHEQMILEMQIQEKNRKEVEEHLRIEKEKEKQEKDEKKQKIQDYRNEKNTKEKQEAERCMKRLEELNEELAEQAKYDWKRIKYRQEQLMKKLDMQEQQKFEKTQEEAEKEKRLEMLREQVRVIAHWNPARVHYGTETWHAKVSKTREKYISIQQPLFSTNTYTSEQVTSDPRFRLEEKLRDAGLLSSNYARAAMNRVKPLHPPRPDLKSTMVLKWDE